MVGLLGRIFGRNAKQGSGNTAKNRLKLTLVHDRISVSPEQLRDMKREIMDVIIRYIPDVQTEGIDLQIEQHDRHNNIIVAHIPFAKPPEKSAVERAVEEEALPVRTTAMEDTVPNTPIDMLPHEPSEPPKQDSSSDT